MTGALGPGAFASGAVLMALTLGCSAAAAEMVTRKRLDHLEGPSRVAATALLTVALMLAANTLPLLVGLLSRATVPVTAGLLLALISRVPSLEAMTADETPPAHARRDSAAGSTLLAAIALIGTATAWIAYLELAATLHPAAVDAGWFHLPDAVRFIQSGTMWQTTQYLPGQAQGNYPQYGDVLLMAAALPWHSLAFVRYVDPPLLAIAALGTYATAIELGAPRATSALVAVALVTIHAALGPALTDALVDPLLLAGMSVGVLFLTRHWRTGERSELVLAGIGLGLALGTKWYALTDVPIVIAAWALAWALTRGPRSLRPALGLLVGVTVLAGGIWLLRNAILTGNPVFDYRVRVLGVTIFPAPFSAVRSQIGLTLAHYLGDTGVLRHDVWPVFRTDFGLAGGLIAAGALATAVALMRDRRRDPRLIVLLCAGIACAIAYAVTPYSAQGLAGAPVLIAANTRYGVPALLLAAPLLAVAAGRLRVGRLVIELALLGAVLGALHRFLPVGAGRIIVTGAGLAVLAAMFRPVRRIDRAGRPGGRRPARPTAAMVVLACFAAALAYHYQRVLAARPYSPRDPTVDYVLAHDPAGTRIGLAGIWTARGLIPVTPLFGPRLENDLRFIGPVRRHRLEEYSTAREFTAALAVQHVTLLEVGTGNPPEGDPALARWARSAGFREVARSPRLILMRSNPT